MTGKEAEKTAAPFIQPDASLDELREAAEHCTGCDLYKNATQTVFGEGPGDAPVMLVGEQPGDAEDARGTRSSVPPVVCSTRRSPRRASTARRSMSRTR